MNDESNNSVIEDLKEIRPQITVEEFITQFEDLESGKLYRLPNYPSNKEAQHISKLKIETSILELSDGEVLIAKGRGKTQTALTRGELVVLKLRKKIHTHPVQPVNPKGLKKLTDKVEIRFEDINQEIVAKMGNIIPSPVDLTIGSVGASTYEIWSEYGKTTYQTYSNENEDMLELARQMAENLYSGKEFMTILVNKDLTIEEKVKKMNLLLEVLGLAFEFQPWEK